jgi:hypothetical protein
VVNNQLPPGLLGQMGLSTVSDSMRNDYNTRRAEAGLFANQAGFRGAGARAAAMIGGNLGAGLGARFANAPTKSELQQQQIIDKANKKYKRLRGAQSIEFNEDGSVKNFGEFLQEGNATGDDTIGSFAAMPEEDRVFAYQDFLAEAADEIGRPDISANIRKQVMAERQKGLERDLRLAKFSSDTERAKELAFNRAFTGSMRNNLFNERKAISEQLAIVEEVGSLFENMTLRGQDPREAVGTAGRLNMFASNLIDTMKGVGASAFDFLKQVNPLTGETTFVPAADKASLVSDIRVEVPAGMDAAAYRSAVIELAFAVAKINDPSGRLSDNDFRTAMEQVGANSGSPETLMNTVMNLSTRSLRSYNESVASAVAMAKEAVPEWSEQSIKKRLGIYSPEFDERLDSIKTRFSGAAVRMQDRIDEIRRRQEQEEANSTRARPSAIGDDGAFRVQPTPSQAPPTPAPGPNAIGATPAARQDVVTPAGELTDEERRTLEALGINLSP